jgi:hypothetical protein
MSALGRHRVYAGDILKFDSASAKLAGRAGIPRRRRGPFLPGSLGVQRGQNCRVEKLQAKSLFELF